MNRLRPLLILLVLAAIGCASTIPSGPPSLVRPDNPGEPNLRNIRQLTFGGDNAEAYWSWGQNRVIYQMRGREGVTDDQMFTMLPNGAEETLVSTGKGRTTCGYFLPGDEEIVYSSTHHLGDEAPESPPATPGKYTWPLFDYDIYAANADGSNLRVLTSSPFYDAEPTIAPDGTIVFTSARDGDLEIYTMDRDGGNLRRLTQTRGYDGGPFFSADGSKIVYRANHPETEEQYQEYKALLDSGRIQPTRMDVWVMDRDGSNQRQVTNLPGANWAPFFHPDGERIIFASNHADPRGRNFDLYMINIDGTGLEQITNTPEFDAFPMFSWDGKYLMWCSNRFSENARDTNTFIAEWVESK
jgi:Tol biopolymer transport system component